MRNLTSLVLVAVVMAFAAPAFAHEGHKGASTSHPQATPMKKKNKKTEEEKKDEPAPAPAPAPAPQQ